MNRARLATRSHAGHGKAAVVGVEQGFVAAPGIWIGFIAHNVKREPVSLSFQVVGDIVVLGTVPFVLPQGGLFPMFAVFGDRIVRMPTKVPPFPQFLRRIPLRAGAPLNSIAVEDDTPFLWGVQRTHGPLHTFHGEVIQK